jgi:hypothetical protein
VSATVKSVLCTVRCFSSRAWSRVLSWIRRTARRNSSNCTPAIIKEPSDSKAGNPLRGPALTTRRETSAASSSSTMLINSKSMPRPASGVVTNPSINRPRTHWAFSIALADNIVSFSNRIVRRTGDFGPNSPWRRAVVLVG